MALGLQTLRGTMIAMETQQLPLGEYVATSDHRVVMYGVSWESYEAMLAIRGTRSSPLMAYLDGALELMTTSEGHEQIKSAIGRLLEAFMLDKGIPFMGIGNWTMRAQLKRAGIEADECYRLGADQTRGRWPDLAFEVTWTSGGIDKLEAYRRIGVREVWFWKDDAIRVFVLRDSGYVEQAASEQVAGFDLALACSLVDRTTINDAVRELRASYKAG
jgi:Uma2 family endonuclease